jgi:uncharacterized protein (TIGR02996 family)
MHEEFLAALRENPNDNVSRLVYADWLDEQGDPLAEFVRLEVRLAGGGITDDERREMANRLAELGRGAERGWLMAVNRWPFVRCSLARKSGGSPLDGTLELSNYATRRMVIAFNAGLLQYIRLKVTAPFGEVSDEPYDEFTLHPTRQHALNPGERMSARVNLLNTIAATEITVGAYAVEARYDYDGVVSRSDPVRLELTDEDRRKWKLGRYARE